MLLEEPGAQGYAIEYLVARVCGRRSLFVHSIGSMVGTDAVSYLGGTRYAQYVTAYSNDGPSAFLASEFQWAYRQMDPDLRAAFAPFIGMFEVETICRCLRFVRASEYEKPRIHLQRSLLAADIKKTISLGLPLRETVDRLSDVLTNISKSFVPLKDLKPVEDTAEYEAALIDSYFEYVSSLRMHAAVGEFMKKAIDGRNILHAYKCLRWGLSAPRSFAKGGDIPVEKVASLVSMGGMEDITDAVRSIFGIRPRELSPLEIELCVLRGLTRLAKKLRREYPAHGTILDYLWRCRIEARDLSVVLYGKPLIHEAVEGALVS